MSCFSCLFQLLLNVHLAKDIPSAALTVVIFVEERDSVLNAMMSSVLMAASVPMVGFFKHF